MKNNKYEFSIVTFIDILGFSKLVNTASSKRIGEILDSLSVATTPDLLEKKTFQLSSFIFSDSVVQIVPINSRVNKRFCDGILFHQIVSLAHAQIELTSKEILIRGAVTVGDIYCNKSKNQIFGPALIESHSLESNGALYPRIIVDEKLLKEFRHNKLLRNKDNTFDQDKSELNSLITKGEDGSYFIDYLKIAVNDLDPETELLGYLIKHKQMIDKGLASSTSFNILRKYQWLSEYHNKQINQLNQKSIMQIIEENDISITFDDLKCGNASII